MKIFRLLALLLVIVIMIVGCNSQGGDDNEITKPTETSVITQASQNTGDAGEGENTENIGDTEDTEDKDDTSTPENGDTNADQSQNGSAEQKPDDNEGEDSTLKILTIGNSFSEDTMQYMYQIAESAGYEKIKLGNLFIGGCTLNTHAANARGDKAAYDYRRNSSGTWNSTANFKMSDAIKEEDWDYISLQQASGSSGKADTYTELEYLIGYVKALAPKAKLVWNMTWAYQQDTTHKEFAKYSSSQKVMYESIISTVLDCVVDKDDISVIVPNGTAIQNARSSYVGDKLTRDGFHLTLDLGRYTAGLTFFHAVTGKSIEDISYMPSGVDKNLQRVAIESAVNAVKSPWAVTKSKYIEEPEIDFSQYDKLNLQWTEFGYWHSNNSNGPYNAIITEDIDFCQKYYATARFTKEDIPIGSIIVLADGWRYRPEGWTDEGRLTSARPGNKTDKLIVVNDGWWGSYIYRAFNLSKTDGSSLADVSLEEIEKAFIIYVPKNN